MWFNVSQETYFEKNVSYRIYRIQRELLGGVIIFWVWDLVWEREAQVHYFERKPLFYIFTCMTNQCHKLHT